MADSEPGITNVTLLYTANLSGELGLLPYLATLIQRERQKATGAVLLLDIGDTCSPDAWVCRATQGRAPLIVLDGMAYDAVLIGGPECVPIPPASLRRLRETMTMPVALWDRTTAITKRGILFVLAAGKAKLPPGSVCIRVDRSIRSLPQPGDPCPVLGDVAQGCLARVDITWPDWIVQSAHLFDESQHMPPDPGILALVDFVQSEARFFAQQGGGS
ncbi:MAG: hypothetical protein JW966_14600 [Anaerolineae bacterium]|nr:hypothetical protein [Anaerolineae bacterium]